MPKLVELRPLVEHPREDLAIEYKTWLNLTDASQMAVLAKAAIAIANHCSGYIIIGMRDEGTRLVSVPRPDGIPATEQDAVNAVIKRFATPAFHCQARDLTFSKRHSSWSTRSS